MRRRKVYLWLVTVFLCGFICISSAIAASSKYVAKVNGKGIKAITLEAAINNFVENQKMLGVQIKEKDKARLHKDILEQLISAELLYQESKRAKLGDLKQEVKKQFEDIKKGFKSEDEFKKLLKQRGIAEKDLKEDIKKGVYIKTFLDRNIYNKIVVSETEKRQEFEKNKDKLNIPEQVKASHILIRVKQNASDKDKDIARKKIEQLRKRALSGEDFAELAKKNSQDTSAAKGGDLGYFRKGMMIKPFEDAAFNLQVGQISKVVESKFGYHIIKLLDKQPARALSYKEVEPSIAKFLINQKRKKTLDKFVEGLKKHAKIEIF